MLTKILALTVLALVTSSSTLAAAGGCHAISGTYINHNVPCTVPALACVETEVAGDLAGTSTTIITSFIPATQTYSGISTNLLENGAVITSTIVGSFLTGGSVTNFTGGTRQFAHATGGVTTNSATGTYAGEYCLGYGGDGD